MPPVQKTISAPSSSVLLIAAVIFSWSSPTISWAVISQPYSAIFSWITGVKVSCIRLWKTSLPVMTRPYFFRLMGSSFNRGLSPAAWRARSIFSFSIIKGITRTPHSLSSFFTGNPDTRDAITIPPKLFTLRKLSISTIRRPSISANNSILPSLGPTALIFSLWQIARRISAASFSWSIFPLSSHI